MYKQPFKRLELIVFVLVKLTQDRLLPYRNEIFRSVKFRNEHQMFFADFAGVIPELGGIKLPVVVLRRAVVRRVGVDHTALRQRNVVIIVAGKHGVAQLFVIPQKSVLALFCVAPLLLVVFLAATVAAEKLSAEAAPESDETRENRIFLFMVFDVLILLFRDMIGKFVTVLHAL